MRVREVILRNVRDVPELRVELAPGLNWITGPNGAGKTTLLQALGWALFDAPLARAGDADGRHRVEDEARLEVEVAIEQAGEAYRVVREASADGSPSSWRVEGPGAARGQATAVLPVPAPPQAPPQTDAARAKSTAKGAKGKTSSATRVRAKRPRADAVHARSGSADQGSGDATQGHAGQEPEARGDAAARTMGRLLGVGPADLPRLFTTLVGIADGDLHRLFLADESERARMLGPLLGLDRYPRAMARVDAAGRSFAADLALLEREGQGFEVEAKGLREMLARLEACGRESEAAETSARDAEARLAVLAAEAERLEGSRAQAASLERERAVLEEALRGLAERVTAAARALEEAEEASHFVTRAETAARRWESLEADCRNLEQKRHEQDALRREVTELEARDLKDRSAIDAEREQLTSALELNQQEAERILSERDAVRSILEGLRARARKLDGTGLALDKALDRSTQVVELLKGAAASEPDPEADREASLREAAARRAEEAARDATRDAHHAELEALSTRARTEDDALVALREAREAEARLVAVLAEARKHLESVRPSLGACPLLHAPCSNIGGASLVGHFEAEIGRGEEGRASLGTAIRSAEARAEEARAARRELERKEKERPDDAPPHAARPGASERRATAGKGRFDFDTIGHHVSALAGVVTAMEPPDEDERPVVALLSSVAGEDAPQPAAAGSRLGGFAPGGKHARISLPDLLEIEEAQRLADEGAQASKRPGSADGDARIADLATALARVVRRVHASTATAHAEVRTARAASTSRSRAAESLLHESGKSLEALGAERTRLRAALKELSPRELKLLDVELALSDRRMKLGAFERLERELASMRREQSTLASERESFRAKALVASRVEPLREEWKELDRGRLEAEARLARVTGELQALAVAADPTAHARVAREREELHVRTGELREAARAIARERAFLGARVAELESLRDRLLTLDASRARARAGCDTAPRVRSLLEALGPAVSEAVRREVAGVASGLHAEVTGRAARLVWAADLGLRLESEARARPFAALSRGEQVTAAVALVLALLRQHPRVGFLCLDEPAAHLDAARKAAFVRAIGPFQAAASGWLEQVLVVSHDEHLGPPGAHRIRLPGRR